MKHKKISLLVLGMAIVFKLFAQDTGINQQKSIADLNPVLFETLLSDQFSTLEGKLKKESGASNLLIAKFKVSISKDCFIHLNRTDFCCSSVFRTTPKMIVSRDVAVISQTGNKWLNDKSDPLVLLKKGNEIEIWAVFEVHKELREFEFYSFGSLSEFSVRHK